MPNTAKLEVETMLKTLPEDVTLEDIQYHLYIIEKVKKGQESAKTGKTFTQDQVEEKMQKWILK